MKYRDDVPLDDRDYAAIRARVRERVAAAPTFRWRYAVAFAVAVVLVVVLWPKPQAPVATVSRHPLPQVPRYAQHDSEIAPPPVVIARKPHHRTHHRHPKVAITAARPTVIHLQTSNPDVRIIWIGGNS